MTPKPTFLNLNTKTKGGKSINKDFPSFLRVAHKGYATIGFSLWNIGEASVVFDKYEKMGLVDNGRRLLEKLLGESKLLTSLEALKLVNITLDIVLESIKLVFRHHIYVADALQIASTKKGFDEFATADRKVAEVAKAEKLTTVLIG